MKKIFILPILIAPIIAHATDPVGPAHVNSGAVVATANAPYAIATPETGDTTNVVSASYVKGAYNDAIAAINNVANKVSIVDERVDNLFDQVNDDMYDAIESKQDKLTSFGSGGDISAEVIGTQEFFDYMAMLASGDGYASGTFDDVLVTADGVADGIMGALRHTGVKAVTTWGSNTETTLSFSPN